MKAETILSWSTKKYYVNKTAQPKYAPNLSNIDFSFCHVFGNGNKKIYNITHLHGHQIGDICESVKIKIKLFYTRFA